MSRPLATIWRGIVRAIITAWGNSFMAQKEYLKEGAGYIDITLKKPATIAGAQVSVLRMREPTVGDLEASQASGLGAAASEITMFANLLEISADELRVMPLANYVRIQAAYENFTD